MDLQEYLDTMTVEGDLYEVVDAGEKKIRCYACGHRYLRGWTRRLQSAL